MVLSLLSIILLLLADLTWVLVFSLWQYFIVICSAVVCLSSLLIITLFHIYGLTCLGSFFSIYYNSFLLLCAAPSCLRGPSNSHLNSAQFGYFISHKKLWISMQYTSDREPVLNTASKTVHRLIPSLYQSSQKLIPSGCVSPHCVLSTGLPSSQSQLTLLNTAPVQGLKNVPGKCTQV